MPNEVLHKITTYCYHSSLLVLYKTTMPFVGSPTNQPCLSLYRQGGNAQQDIQAKLGRKIAHSTYQCNCRPLDCSNRRTYLFALCGGHLFALCGGLFALCGGHNRWAQQCEI